ncbi:phage tail tape measure protein [Escherichia coli]|nr:phage tail tape measure protein [Escherichia coli]
MSQPVGDLVIDLSLDAVRFDEQMSRVRRHFSGLDTDARKTATVVEQGLSRQALAAQKAGISVGQYKAAMRTLPAQFTDIATQLAGGQNPWLILLQQGGQVKDAFGGMIPMFRGLAGAITLPMVGVTSLAVATGALAYAWYQGDSTLSAFNKTLVLSGNQSGLTAERMLTLSRAGQAAGLTFNQASESLVSGQEKSLLAHEKETLEYKRQLADLGDKVEHQKRLNELAQQAARFEQQQSAKQAAISAKARGLSDRQAQRESEAQRLRDVYGDNPQALAKATSALKNTWSAEEQLRGSWMAGLKSGWGEWAESAMDSFSQVKSAATQTVDGIAQNMAAMLTGSEQNWRSFTRSVLSMMTEILLKQAMVGIVGSIGSAIGFAGGGFTGTGGKYEPAGIVHRGEFVFTKEATSRIGVGNLYRLMRGYAEGGYVGGAGSPAQMRRAEGINFNQNNHVVIQNDGINGQAGPKLLKAVYDMARKGAQDELRLQLRDGGLLSGSGR